MYADRAFSRRGFLAHLSFLGSASLAALTAPSWMSGSAAAGTTGSEADLLKGGRRLMLDKVTVSHFAEHLGSRFRLATAEGPSLEVELLEAQALHRYAHARADDGRAEPFTLLFRGPAGDALPQHMYALEHDVLGKLDVFLVPVGSDREGVLYEAVFN